MKAEIGDWVVIKRARLGEPLRRAQIVELRHPDGTPPYVIRWLDTGQVALLFPGPDAHVEHKMPERPATLPAHPSG
ncbi:MAG TPA: DUF1918 domain-containing protein [Actinomycetes bacterium]|jgi:hypothetical protein|nr:DUF1918 domain-containing protein [Actinomycetes bacterium]